MAIALEIRDTYPRLPESSPSGQELDWAWLAGHPKEWGVRPKPGPRGLTMMDIAVGSYGDVPEHPRHRAMAARGADIDEDTPDMGYILNSKSAVWSDNVVELYGLLPDAQLAVLPGATHTGVPRRPAGLLALITPFLDARPA